MPRLVALCHHRWSIPVLAELRRMDGAGRFVQLIHRLDVGPDSLGHTLQALVQQGYVRRNPGYGHPLRPEYLLTKTGHRVAGACQRIIGLAEKLDLDDLILRKWTLPSILAIGQDRSGHRFAEIRQILQEVTPKALANALREMEDSRMLDREIIDSRPPGTVYALSGHGRRLFRAMRAFYEV